MRPEKAGDDADREESLKLLSNPLPPSLCNPTKVLMPSFQYLLNPHKLTSAHIAHWKHYPRPSVPPVASPLAISHLDLLLISFSLKYNPLAGYLPPHCLFGWLHFHATPDVLWPILAPLLLNTFSLGDSPILKAYLPPPWSSPHL